ncbi:MAG: D-aminoacyl-tRNA deacylase [Verrucomicrobiota bacterium]
MRAVLQRVSEASVTIDGKLHAAIGGGLLILVGVTEGDEQGDMDWLIKKICGLRLFESEEAKGVGDLSLLETKGEALVISQFTLLASVKKGTKPSYHRAAKPKEANEKYQAFVKKLSAEISREVKTGIFGAEMKVALINEGPVTICLDSKNRE